MIKSLKWYLTLYTSSPPKIEPSMDRLGLEESRYKWKIDISSQRLKSKWHYIFSMRLFKAIDCASQFDYLTKI